ncbi:IclR family transcriptional regulator [Alicyclobacillus sp. SO9]|uniref:IclR family transcriptional regulator n=1 Tax=Alicyclobacillus sp. SO9 TaxID=2665646 RepID=UPI0018E89D2D|nr:IclR family transcriptional regulator [Alicyclobacillus sp. SO9]QQE77958.1 IclR family transcriptional regulator [Alicyclobacillus sp. SO9]
MEKKPAYRAPALEKGLDILEALSVSSVPQTLTELSRTLDRSPSELFRMIGLLEKRGYIIKDNYGYYLSLKLYELAHTHSLVGHILRAARQPMRDLSVVTRESCHLSILHNDELLVLAQEESPEKVRLSIEVGSKFPAFETVSGRLLLAHLNRDEFETYCRTNPQYLDLTSSQRENLDAQLDFIREHGYSVAENDTHYGVRDLAVLIGNTEIGVTAAIAVTSLTAKRTKRQSDDTLEILNKYASIATANMGLSSKRTFLS